MPSIKRFKFPKGIEKVYIPFLIHDFSPWQDQVEEGIKKAKSRNGISKSAMYGFEIGTLSSGDIYSNIIITKTK